MERKTKIVLAWKLHEQGVSNSQIARDLQVNREAVNRWITSAKEQGLSPFLEARHKGQNRPRPSRQVPVHVKQKMWFLREREGQCCMVIWDK